MPVYFFHLGFGERVLPDEDGVELPNRAAARAEAVAVIDDLAHHVGSDTRHWANWFVLVSDADGPFLRMPIGQSNLAVVAGEVGELGEEQFVPTGTLPALPATPLSSTLAGLIRQSLERKQATSRLSEKNRRLREELSLQMALSQAARGHAAQVMARAKLVVQAGACEVAATQEHSAHPHLVLLPGGKR